MPKKSKYIPMQVALTSEDQKRLSAISMKTKRPKSELGREAIRYFLDNFETMESDKSETQLVQAIDKMANRVCAMLNRQGTDIGTLYELTYQSMPDSEKHIFTACLNKTKERLRKRQTADERKLSERMKSVVTQGVKKAAEASEASKKKK